MTVIEDSANQLYIVRDAGAGLEHVYLGTPAKRIAGGYVPKAKTRERLVRRAVTRIVHTD